ncbi:MAG: exodeoxyribonuclease VII small subunit [Gammaproteobacteria bacterium]|nr:exodeoxyribonuclease VII small subunit [Gammaproteobacteria bacterium]
MSENTPPAPPFEEALSELEALVERLEHGNLSLEESLATFERGVALTRTCQQSLKAAEQKVHMLAQQSGDAGLVPFGNDE